MDTIHTLVYDIVTGRLDMPCSRVYGIRRNAVGCEYEEDGHGHIVLASDDGFWLVPVPIYSRPFMETVFDLLVKRGTIERSEVDCVLEQARELALGMNEIEIALISDQPRLDRLLTSWWSGV